MNRRRLLATIGGLSAAASAGCLGSGGGDAGEPETGTPTETPGDAPTESPAGEHPSFDPAADEPAWSRTVGDRDAVAFPDDTEPITAVVWNDGPERTFRVVVGCACDAVLDETVTLAADAYLSVTFAEPGSYDLRLGVGDGDLREIAAYEPGLFDCNATTTTVQVTADGDVRSATESTTMGCLGPDVADVAFEQAPQGECGSEDAASVGTEGRSVVVDGRVVTPVPCYDLALVRADYDGSADRLAVDVAADERQDGICTECVGEVPYEARVAFEHGYPGTVRVRHRRDGEWTVVTTATL